MDPRRKALALAPIFEGLDPGHLDALADMARMRRFETGERLIEEGAEANACFILGSGRVRLVFEPPAINPQAEGRTEGGVTVRDYDDPGRFLGWSALIPPHRYRGTVSALEPTEVIELSRDTLESYLRRHPVFGIAFMKRVIWVVGSRLRETRIRLVAKRFHSEIAAIRALLEQSAPQLSVDSPLHKIPFYLEHRLTLGDAFQALEMLRAHGTPREKDLAELSLEILKNVRKELDLYQGLQRVYETVASAAPDSDPETIRRLCCDRFVEVFDKINYVIEGWENLPEKPGFLVVMNHLINHPDNMLPNAFQLTLDTHFVSSMILYRKYGQPPIRVVRRSWLDEYGHQRYYDRLGYIYVYSGHVDQSIEDPEITQEDRRKFFLDAARAHLLAGRTVVICPEGTSVPMADSPVAFKSGAFRLAAYVKPEPLIVPIAVANFDQKITRAKVSARIFEPFRLSERVADGSDEALHAFIERFNAEFREFVREAIRLTA
jgi:CRP-like cAMP-binding protein/1-acyl-sn-glycerol-3-phosphate acyltransferase